MDESARRQTRQRSRIHLLPPPPETALNTLLDLPAQPPVSVNYGAALSTALARAYTVVLKRATQRMRE